MAQEHTALELLSQIHNNISANAIHLALANAEDVLVLKPDMSLGMFLKIVHDLGSLYDDSWAEAGVFKITDDKDRRIQELLVANNIFEERGRMAERMCRAIERMAWSGTLANSTTGEVASRVAALYRQKYPRP